MEITNIVPTVMYTVCMIIIIFDICLTLKRKKQIETDLDLLSELLFRTQKEIKLKEIIINSKLSKENFFITLEKIERELFNNNSLNSENKD